ncbi:MAG: GNAT family N-acetyltransferase [Burkholderiales bacterium]
MYQTERLVLRNWTNDDLTPCIALNQDPAVMEFFPHPYTAEETIAAVERFKQHLIDYGFTMYACEFKSNQQFIGLVGLRYCDFAAKFTPCVEIGWRLAKEYWGQGLAVEAASRCLAIGFDQFKLEEIVSFTAKINKRSERIMQKLGMVHQEQDNFFHPKLPFNHPLSLHVLYRMNKVAWLKQQS